jgi:hypothetical protein
MPTHASTFLLENENRESIAIHYYPLKPSKCSP